MSASAVVGDDGLFCDHEVDQVLAVQALPDFEDTDLTSDVGTVSQTICTNVCVEDLLDRPDLVLATDHTLVHWLHLLARPRDAGFQQVLHRPFEGDLAKPVIVSGEPVGLPVDAQGVALGEHLGVDSLILRVATVR